MMCADPADDGYMRTIVRRSACAIALTVSALPSPAPAEDGPGVAGTLYPGGSFRPAVQRRVAAQAATPTYAGTITLNLTINVVSDATRIDRSAPIKCLLNAAVGGSDSVTEQAQTVAAISGSQAVCRLLIPYSWTLTAAGQDYVTLGYNISFFDSNGDGRNSYVQMPTIDVPVSGSATAYNRSARL